MASPNNAQYSKFKLETLQVTFRSNFLATYSQPEGKTCSGRKEKVHVFETSPQGHSERAHDISPVYGFPANAI